MYNKGNKFGNIDCVVITKTESTAKTTITAGSQNKEN